MTRRLVLVGLAAILAGGCSTSSSSSGRATVWVTRDRGAHVVHVGSVPAGLTAIQGLERVAKVETRYGGRYVHAVDGVGEHGQRAWFYYVNGYLADRSGGEYRLRVGDIDWWDFHYWHDPTQDPIVVGAFPEPFLHGYDGKRRPAAIVYRGRSRRRGALALGRLLHARFVGPVTAGVPESTNVLLLTPEGGRLFFEQVPQKNPPRPGGPVFLLFSGDPLELARNPSKFRFHYSVR
ncbi:MAG: DUF4430 domain-containing protein [Gaiellaceae bacterium]